MKNYLDFNLKGDKIFSYFLILFLAMIAYITVEITFGSNAAVLAKMQPTVTQQLISVSLYVFIFTVQLLCMFYVYRYSINSISCKDEKLVFRGNFNEMVKITIKGMLLTIITLGIYSVWFIRNVVRFYADNTSYKGQKISFKGTGLYLFVVIFLYMLVVSIFAFLAGYLVSVSPYSSIILMVVTFPITLAVYLFYVYNWYINFEFAGKKITFRADQKCKTILFLLGQSLLVILTLGLYTPFYIVALYKFYVTRIDIKDDNNSITHSLGCDLKCGADSLYIFGQTLLTIITLGLYYSWAYCNISKRFINKTYIKEI